MFEGVEVLLRCLYCLLRFKFVAASWNRVVQTEDVLMLDVVEGPVFFESNVFEDLVYEFTLPVNLFPDDKL